MPSYIAHSITIAKPAAPHPDAALIDACARFMQAHARWKTALDASADEEGDGPACVAAECKMEQIAIEIEQARASTVDGVLAQLQAFAKEVEEPVRAFTVPENALLNGAIRGLAAIDRKPG